MLRLDDLNNPVMHQRADLSALYGGAGLIHNFCNLGTKGRKMSLRPKDPTRDCRSILNRNMA